MQTLGDTDTIAAIGTARAVGALGVVRVSGPKTAQIVAKCLVSKTFNSVDSHKAYYGIWKNPKTGEDVDQVVLVFFGEGHGFTGEPAADIMCHGGQQVTDMVLAAALDGGARMARPGEFTYRAVMNGRLDLTQAEATLEIINAKSPKAVAQALQNLRGTLSKNLEEVESDLIFILANLEASIDFTTEDIQPVNFAEMAMRINRAAEKTKALLGSYVSGQRVAKGFKVVLAGKPNAGKSSLMNAILGRDRSIVAEEAGTTRDTIEAEMSINGQLVKLIDTAGLRQSENKIEIEGIQRTRRELELADFILYLVDGAAGVDARDLEEIQSLRGRPLLVCLNKADLFDGDLSPSNNDLAKDVARVKTSATTLAGIDEIRQKIVAEFSNDAEGETRGVISTERQYELLTNAIESMTKTASLIENKVSPEVVVFELSESLRHVQSILGKEVGDDVMDRVFREFCIGK